MGESDAATSGQSFLLERIAPFAGTESASRNIRVPDQLAEEAEAISD